MEIDWRTIKLFLSEDFLISEVSIADSDSKKMRCTCPQFNRGGKCKHTDWVRDRMNNGGGVFSITVPEDLDFDDIIDFDNLEHFRDFVIKYGKVEVL